MKRPSGRVANTNDEGSALILALVVVLASGLLVSAALSFAGSGLATTPQVRDQRNQANYVAGAVDAAINKIRSSSTMGGFNPATGTAFPCLSATNDYVPPSPTGEPNTASYRVTCSPQSVSGGSGHKSVPSFAVLTLGSDDGNCTSSGSPKCVGFNVSGNHTLLVSGGLFSHGDITDDGASKGAILVEGSAYGQGPVCDKTLIHTTDGQGPQCPNYVDSNSIGADPKYAAAIGNDTTDPSNAQRGSSAQTLASTTKDPLPSCSGSVATFSPGYYGEIPDELISNPAASGCAGFKVSSGLEVFTAGNYYFDFPPGDSTWSPSSVIGGTVKSGFDFTSSTADWNAACDATQPGVQFEFGGVSAVNFGSQAQMALCGPNPSATDAYQDISLYGVNANNSGAASSAPTATDSLFAASAAPTNTDAVNRYSPETAVVSPPCALCVPNAQLIGDSKTAAVSLAGGATAGLKFSGFNAVPNGARIAGLAVCVADTPDALATPTVTVTRPAHNGVGAKTVTATLTASSTTFTACTSGQLYAVAASDLNTKLVPDSPQWRGINALQVGYSITEDKKATGTPSSTMDGVSLDVSYTSPSLVVLKSQNSASASDCTALSPATADFFCASAPMAATGALFFGGTVYTPGVDLIANTQNKGVVAFSRGVIANSILADANASFKQTSAPFSVPSGTPTLQRLVLLTGYANNVAILRACVDFVDQVVYADGSSGPEIPGYRVKIRHWDTLTALDDASPPCS